MKIVVLSSGSKGNVTYVEDAGKRLLLDIGMSCNFVEKSLKEIGVNAKDIDAILLTHTHIDHVCGLKKFYEKYQPQVYITTKMIKHLNNYVQNIELNYYEEEFNLFDFNLKIIKTSHDVDDSVGFIINDKLVYITDTGYINEKYFPKLKNKEVYIIESNHDLEMLYNGEYPFHLKQRIASDVGHLSNIDSAKYMKKLVGLKTKYIVLAHLSQENNTKEKALETYLEIIEKPKFKIIITSQGETSEVIEI